MWFHLQQNCLLKEKGEQKKKKNYLFTITQDLSLLSVLFLADTLLPPPSYCTTEQTKKKKKSPYFYRHDLMPAADLFHKYTVFKL